MSKAKRGSHSVTTSFILVAAFLGLGFLTACSDVQTEVVANKQATAEKVARSYGPIDGATRADHSLWSLSRKEN